MAESPFTARDNASRATFGKLRFFSNEKIRGEWRTAEMVKEGEMRSSPLDTKW